MAFLLEALRKKAALADSIDKLNVVSKESLFDRDLKKTFSLNIKDLSIENFQEIAFQKNVSRQSMNKAKVKKKRRRNKAHLNFENAIKSYLSDENKLQVLTSQFTSWSLYKTGRIVPLFHVLTRNGAHPMTCNQFICGMVWYLMSPFFIQPYNNFSRSSFALETSPSAWQNQ